MSRPRRSASPEVSNNLAAQELKLFEGASQDARKHHGEVLGLKVRISHLEAELGKFRKLAKTFEERIKVLGRGRSRA